MKRASVPITLLSLLLALVVEAQTLSAPTGLQATGYERHITLAWDLPENTLITHIQIHRSVDGKPFELLKTVRANTRLAVDWTADEGERVERQYALKSVAGTAISAFSAPAKAQTRPLSDEELMEMVQWHTFQYFWDFGHPLCGMARERSNGDDQIVTTGGTGFGVMAMVVAVERGWIGRAEAVDRLVRIVSFLQIADRFHGVFPHWMDGTTGNVIPFSTYDNGGDLVETAFLMQGLLTVRAYFDQNTPLETSLRRVIDKLWEEVEWSWYRRNGGPVLYWHWSPNYGWQMNFPLRGFYEAQIVYILAAAAPKHGVPPSLYQTGWTSGNYANSSVHYGVPIFCGPFGGGPMFFAHYAYLGFDPRFYRDAFCNYFVRNTNHALIQQAHCATNPYQHKGYSAACWGLTSCDSPGGYAAHSIHPTDDDGTIAPTAALASMPYVPAASLEALKHFYRVQGEKLWGVYGFYDAFNLNKNWTAPAWLAIDQGPIVAMMENHRTGLLWRLFMKNPAIVPALLSMGFSPDNTLSTNHLPMTTQGLDVVVSPNPSTPSGETVLHFSATRSQPLRVRLLDMQGHWLHTFFTDKILHAGTTAETVSLPPLAAGVYLLEIQTPHARIGKKLLLNPR